MMKMEKGRMDPAVSPVVGVLLMLVVTIIIAAVVSGFASGMTGGTKEAPVASLDVKVIAKDPFTAYVGTWPNSVAYEGNYSPYLNIKHMSGDTLQTKNLKITTLFKNESSGEFVQGGIAGEVPVTIGGKDVTPLFINDADRFGYASASQSGWFGNESAVFRVGDQLVTPKSYVDGQNGGGAVVEPGFNELFGVNASDPDTGFEAGKTVKITIVDVPSGKSIYDKEVAIQ